MTFHGRERFREAHAGHGDQDAHGHDPTYTVPMGTMRMGARSTSRTVAGRGHDPAHCARDSVDLRRLRHRWVLYGNYFGNAIVVAPEHDVLAQMAKNSTACWL